MTVPGISNPDVLRDEVLAAHARIGEHVRETPVEESPLFGQATGARVHLKLENLQRTGSFKLRGALNTVLSLNSEERNAGVVAASSGNHGTGVACAAGIAHCRATVFVPETAPTHKRATIAAYGADVQVHGADCVLTEIHARRVAAERGMTYISPYNDPRVVAGQGTLGMELRKQVPEADVVYVAVGGGGLISGIGGYLAATGGGVEVVACSPATSPVMHASLEAGDIVEMDCEPTLSDSTAGGLEPGALTFDLCRQWVDRSLVVSEEQIEAALRTVLAHHHTLVEGAAAVAVAGMLADAERIRGRNAVAVLCGANIGLDALRRVLRD